MILDEVISFRNEPVDPRIQYRLKLRDLDVLLAVIRAGGMGKAARSLNMSQPAVSKAIADLERAIGVQLLDRSRHGVVPTPYGLALSRRGFAVFDELRQGMKEIGFLSDPTRGELKIGSTEPLAAGPIAATIDRLVRRSPAFLFDVVAADTATLLRQLEDRAVDIVVVRMYDAVVPDHMQADVLYRDRLVVAAGPRNPLTARRKIGLGQLVDEPWALPAAESLIGASFREAFFALGLPAPRTVVITHSQNVRYQLVVGGRFLTMDAATPLRFTGRRLGIRALPVDLPTTERAVAVITLKHRAPSPLVPIFVATLRTVAQPRSETGGRRKSVG